MPSSLKLTLMPSRVESGILGRRIPLGFTQGYSQYSPSGNSRDADRPTEGRARSPRKTATASAWSAIRFRHNVRE